MKKKATTILASIVLATLTATSTVPAIAEEAPSTVFATESSTRNAIISQYQDVLQKYSTGTQNGQVNIDYMSQNHLNFDYACYGDYNLHYALVDLANDGVPELFISDTFNGDWLSIDSYAIANGQRQNFLMSGYRTHYTIMQNGVVECYGSGGAFNGIRSYHSVAANSATPYMFRFIEHDGFLGPMKYYTGTSDFNVKTQISEYQANAIRAQYKRDYSMRWYPIYNLSGVATEVRNTYIPIFVNGQEISTDQAPRIQSGRTLVPFRSIFQALGCTVDWNNATRTVTGTKNGTTVSLTIGSNVMYKNGSPVYLSVPAKIINGRTMVPVRAISEAFGASVDWNNNERTITVTQ